MYSYHDTYRERCNVLVWAKLNGSSLVGERSKLCKGLDVGAGQLEGCFLRLSYVRRKEIVVVVQAHVLRLLLSNLRGEWFQNTSKHSANS